MPKPLHDKLDVRSFSQGSNYDTNSEALGASDNSESIEMVNMRFEEGDNQSPAKIGGEIIQYDSLNNACFLTAPYAQLSPNYECIGEANIFLEDDNSYHIIEFWAHNPTDPLNPSFIRIDGVVVLMSDKFGLTFDHPLQRDINPNCVGGEIYVTDNNIPPMIFNIRDLMENGGFIFDGVTRCTQKYFAGFNPDEYIIELVGDNNHPIFIQTTNVAPPLAEVIGSNGMPPGMYQYQISKVTSQGDRTAWSKATPMIPVGFGTGSDSAQYPFTKTFGGEVGGLSTFGVHLRFRVDNSAGYDYLEIKRTAYNLGSAPGTPGVEKLLDYRLPLQPDDFYIKDIFDRGALDLDLPAVQAFTQFGSVRKAKAIRYFNKRLILENIEFQQKNIAPQIQFTELGGKKMYPVIQKMTTPTRLDGHKNAFNYAYYRTLTRGEKYGWGTEFFDGNNQVSYAAPVTPNTAVTEDYQNFQMPNRRDIISPETAQYSNATVKAATVEGTAGTTVAQTHEVFDTVDAVSKTDSTEKNVIIGVTVDYLPFHPTSQLDQDVTGHNFQVNTGAHTGNNFNDPTTIVPYNPQAFGLNYYAMGMALNGVTNIPDGIKAFSIVRTRPAKRIFAQGIAYYKGVSEHNLYGKIKNQFYFYSPDLDPDNGVEDLQKIIDSVNNGETRYKIQAVSPLGFFTEAYSAHLDVGVGIGQPSRWTQCDIINYVRILRENGTINTGDTPSNNGTNTGVGMDSPAPDGYGYTGYGKWRTRAVNPTSVFSNAGNGNQLFDITGVIPVSGTTSPVARGSMVQFTLSSDLFDYDIGDPLGAPLDAFTNPATQNWHEPMYIVNIIDTVADIPIQNTINYIETEHYQKVEAWIGTIQSVTGSESFLTVDERTEDFSTTQSNPFIDKVIFTKDADGIEKVWLNVTGLTVPQISVIATAIQAGTRTATFNGVIYIVNGVYTIATNSLTSIYNEVSIVFNPATNPGGFPAGIFKPDVGEKILIRYNTAEALKSFGGESTIHESLFARVDDSNDINLFSTFGVGLEIPFPYGGYEFNINYRRPADMFNLPRYETYNIWRFQDFTLNTHPRVIASSSLRQAMCMFTCESRASLPQEFEINNPAAVSLEKYFPATHYIPRPAIGGAGFLFPQYLVDYPSEGTIFNYGGFRFKPQINIDYSSQDENHTAVSAPRVGYVENTHFCTGIVASIERAENVINAPGLRTFPATNFWVISDDTGEIKYAYDELTEGKGNNLWSITESGICLLVTDKTILYQATGTQLAAIGQTGGSDFISGQIWISKSIGMNDQTWRAAAEGFNVIQGDLSSRRVEALFFTNNESSFRLNGGGVFDLARGTKYHSKLYPYTETVGSQYTTKLCAVYDRFHDEYWVCFDEQDSNVVYAEKKSHYLGQFSYNFDKFTSFKKNTYGMRNAKTYLLNQFGNQINGIDIESKLVGVSAKELPSSKNFSRIRISSNLKPTLVRFYETKENYITDTDKAEIDLGVLPLGLKNYNAWEGFIPRKVAAPRNRVQSRECIFVIKNTGNNNFKIVSSEVGYTLIK